MPIIHVMAREDIALPKSRVDFLHGGQYLQRALVSAITDYLISNLARLGLDEDTEASDCLVRYKSGGYYDENSPDVHIELTLTEPGLTDEQELRIRDEIIEVIILECKYRFISMLEGGVMSIDFDTNSGHGAMLRFDAMNGMTLRKTW